MCVPDMCQALCLALTILKLIKFSQQPCKLAATVTFCRLRELRIREEEWFAQDTTVELWLLHCLPGILCGSFCRKGHWGMVYVVLSISSDLCLLFYQQKLGVFDKIWENIHIIVFINRKSVIYTFSLFIDLSTLDLFQFLMAFEPLETCGPQPSASGGLD